MASISAMTLLWNYGTQPIVITIIVCILVLHLIIKVICVPRLFPAFMEWFTKGYNKSMDTFKEELLARDLQALAVRQQAGDADMASVSLDILEIGVGTGANFKYYPDGTSVVAIEPNANFLKYLEKSVAVHSPRVRLLRTVIAHAEDLRGHVDDCSMDAVVSTLVLCSVKDLDAVMREAKRVLKPGGRFYFLDHVAAEPGTWLRTVQWVLYRPWHYVLDGCHLNRTPWINVNRAGFSSVEYKKFTAPIGIAVLQPHAMGTATK